MMLPALHGAIAILLDREARALEYDAAVEARRLRRLATKAYQRAGYEGTGDGGAWLFGWSESLGGEA